MKVLVTNCTRNSGLFVMRALHQAGLDIVGVDKRRLPFALHSRCAPPYELIESVDTADFIDGLLRVIEKHKPDVLLPLGGSVLQASQAKETLCQWTTLLVPEFETFVAVNDKRFILEQCKRCGVPCPELLDAKGAKTALRDGLIEAVVVKPLLHIGGGAGVSIITDAEELNWSVADIENRFGEALITEYVPGPDSNNVALHVVFDRESRPIGCFSIQKTRLHPPRVGISAAAVSVHRWDLLRLVRPLFARLRWQGPADIEFKIDSRTGEARFIEVNPRFSGALGFAIGCGVNLPLLTCKAALGERLPVATAPDFRAGVKCWNPAVYARAIIAAAKSGNSLFDLPAQISSELRGDRTGSPYRLSDPAPLVGKILHQIRECSTIKRTKHGLQRSLE